MNAADIMTRDVRTIGPNATVREAAALLLANRISAAPVVDASKVVGIISQGDIAHPDALRSNERQSWWLQRMAEGEDLAPGFLDYIRSGSTLVRDLMTRDVVAVDESTPVSEIAALLISKDIKRVPVLRGGKLVGIVSRADLLKALIQDSSI